MNRPENRGARQSTAASAFSRSPVLRAPTQSAGAVKRVKGRPYGSASANRASPSSDNRGRGFDRGHRPSVGLTIGGFGDNYAGYVGLGRTTSGPRLYGGIRYTGDHRYGRLRSYYYNVPYYRYYSPIYYWGRRYYEPWYGYTYTSLYYPDPYVYRFYDVDVYQIDRVYEGGDVYGAAEAGEQAVAEAPPAPTETYRVLTEPSDATLIGQGNAAFAAGRYDEARRLYVSAVLADERDGYAKLLYALANFAVGDYEVAGMAIRRALLTTPELIEYPVDVRSLYPNVLVLETQLAELSRYVDAHARDRGALLLLGYLQYAGGDPSRALPVLSKLAGADPDDSVASLLRDAAVRVTRGKQPGD